MERQKPYRLPLDISNQIKDFFDRQGTINSCPIPDRLRNSLTLTFDSGESWGKIKVKIGIARQCNLVMDAHLNMRGEDTEDANFCLVCIAECEGCDIEFIRYSRRIISMKFTSMRAVALTEYTVELLYNEMGG